MNIKMVMILLVIIVSVCVFEGDLFMVGVGFF